MRRKEIAAEQHPQGALSLAKEWFDTLFDHAAVMMHAVDKDQKIVKVNRRWLETLGYEKDEVLGRKPTDFLIEESRARAVEDVLPLFWRAGSDRSVAFQFVRKDSLVLDVLLDADVCPVNRCEFTAFAALHDTNDPIQWEQASTTLSALKEIATVQHMLQSLPAKAGSTDPDPPAVQQSPGRAPEAGLAEEALGAFLELAQDISVNLRGLLRVQEEWLGTSVEQQRELLLIAKNIEKTLAELAGLAGSAHSDSE